MNPQMQITAHQNRLDPDSEGVYDYNFFMGLDGAAAALDNVEASEHTSSVFTTLIILSSSYQWLYESTYRTRLTTHSHKETF